MTRPVLTARHYALLAVGAAAFIVYGSLVPFGFTPRPWPDVVDGFWRVAEGGVAVGSRSDFVANCLLGTPLGFCLLAALRVDRPGRGIGAAVAVWPACVALAVAVEFAQAYLPARTASLSDVLAQGIGAAVGVGLWLSAGQRQTDWFRETWRDPRVGTAGRVLVGYAVVVVAVQLLPLDLTISPAVVYRKFRDGHATLTPFGEWFRPDGEVAPNRWGKVQTWLELAGLYLPAGMLAARWRPGLGIGAVAAGGFAFAAATELGQLFVSRHPSVTDALVGAVGALVGWAVSREAPAERARPSFERSLLLGQAWFAALAVAHWQPFDFVSGSSEQRLAAVTWLPFADLATRNAIGALNQTIERLILFVPLGVLVAARGGSGRFAVAVGFATALVLELGQLFLPDRYPSTTDLLTAALGAWFGATVAQRILAR